MGLSRRVDQARFCVTVLANEFVPLRAQRSKNRIGLGAHHIHWRAAQSALRGILLWVRKRFFECGNPAFQLIHFGGKFFQSQPSGDVVKDFQYV